MLPEPGEAKLVEEWKPFNAKEPRRKIATAFFESGQIDRAKAIKKALEGMDIASAQELLDKMKEYLLLDTIT